MVHFGIVVMFIGIAGGAFNQSKEQEMGFGDELTLGQYRLVCQSFSQDSNANFDTDSYLQFAEGYFLRRDNMMWFWDQYTTDPAERAEITASPLNATLEDLDGLPPALIINGEADVLRDEGEAYGDKLRAAGVPVTAVRYAGMIHDFVMLDILRKTHAAEAAIAQAAAFISAVVRST